MRKVAVIGTTAWGTTLAVMLAAKGLEVWLWARTEAEAEILRQARENKRRLPGVTFPPALRLTASTSEALQGAEMLILAVPSQRMRQNLRQLKKELDHRLVILSASKGIEVENARRMSEVIAEELGPEFESNICVLSGPNFSQEVARGLPTATVVAATSSRVARAAQEVVFTPRFRAYTNEDVIGVELGGALKNVIALSAGISDGLGFGANTKAALITRGLAEIIRLGVACGAQALTFSGLSGLGDLVATCFSHLSRNRFVGQELGRGRKLPEVLASLGSVAEGVETTRACLKLARRLGVEMPIAEQVHRVLFENLPPHETVPALMERELKHELSGM